MLTVAGTVAKDAAELFRTLWDDDIELVASFYLLMLNEATRLSVGSRLAKVVFQQQLWMSAPLCKPPFYPTALG
jgi:hypothetical protein